MGVLAGLLAAIVLTGAREGEAAGYRWWAQWNDANAIPEYTAAFKPWVLDGQTSYWCNGLRSEQAVWDAVAEWEAAFAFPFNEFTEQCGSGQSMDIVDNIGWPGYPCGDDVRVVACVDSYYYTDSYRGGKYFSYMRVWINRAQNVFTYTGLRATVLHEMGHIYGLGDQYLEGYACDYNAVPTIMNSVVRDIYGRISGGCQTNSLTASDKADAQEFFVMGTPGFQPLNLDSSVFPCPGGVGYCMRITWQDASPTESRYSLYAYYWTGSRWWLYNSKDHSSQIAPGDPWQYGYLHNSFSKMGYPSGTFYQVCMYLYSGVIGNRYWKCFPPRLLF